jgi:hypothetical protein
MNAQQTEFLVQASRRQLWCALLFILALGIFGIVQLLHPGTGSRSGSFGAILPVLIVIVVGAMRRAGKAGDVSAKQMQAVVNDELRHASLYRAYRAAFVSVLILQPLLAVVVTQFAVANAVPVMAGATVMAGAVIALATLLYYDR